MDSSCYTFMCPSFLSFFSDDVLVVATSRAAGPSQSMAHVANILRNELLLTEERAQHTREKQRKKERWWWWCGVGSGGLSILKNKRKQAAGELERERDV